MSDSDSDDDPNLGSFRPVRLFQRSTTPSNTTSNQLSPSGLKTNDTDGLGDFQELIYFFREKGAFPNPSPIPNIELLSELKDNNLKSDSASLVKHSKHSNSLSNTSDITTTSLSSAAAYLSPPSSPDNPATGTTGDAQRYKGKEVRWTDSVPDGSEFECNNVKQKDAAPSITTHEPILNDTSLGFLPSSIIPPPPLQQPYINRLDIHPKYTLTLAEKRMKLIKKLSKNFFDEPDIVGNPSRIIDLGSNKSSEGIHVFVDLSNILIGFANQLKADRKIPKAYHTRQPPIAFHSLAMVLERGRQVARRVLAGSTPPNPNEASANPSYIIEAKAFGYEVNILERVRKLKPSKPKFSRHKKASSASGYTTGGDSSVSESVNAIVNAEQAVDEILHLKMMESILDNDKPSTMVVASGDAARAEYSEGFLAMVLRALKRGWKVEVVAWKDALSFDYKSPTFLKSWENQFKVILLDDYAEEMLAIYAQKFVMMDMNSYNRFV